MSFPDHDQRARLLEQARRQDHLDDPTFAYLELIGEGYDEGRREVIRVNTRVRLYLYGLVAVVVALAVFATVSFWRQADLNDQTRALAQSNRTGIRVGCTLLTNAIIQSGGADPAPGNRPTPQAQLTGHYIRVIQRVSTPAERRVQRRLIRLAAKAGPVIKVPDCTQIALHPDRVKALALRLRP